MEASAPLKLCPDPCSIEGGGCISSLMRLYTPPVACVALPRADRAKPLAAAELDSSTAPGPMSSPWTWWSRRKEARRRGLPPSLPSSCRSSGDRPAVMEVVHPWRPTDPALGAPLPHCSTTSEDGRRRRVAFPGHYMPAWPH